MLALILNCNEPLELYPIENGIELLLINILESRAKVNNPPAETMNCNSGVYEGAIKGVRTDFPFDILNVLTESNRSKKLIWLSDVAPVWARASWVEKALVSTRVSTSLIIAFISGKLLDYWVYLKREIHIYFLSTVLSIGNFSVDSSKL